MRLVCGHLIKYTAFEVAIYKQAEIIFLLQDKIRVEMKVYKTDEVIYLLDFVFNKLDFLRLFLQEMPYIMSQKCVCQMPHSYGQWLRFKEDLMRALVCVRENISIVFMCYIEYQSH